MNRLYARRVLDQATGTKHDLTEDREAIDFLADELRKTYKNGQDNPNGELLTRINKAEGKYLNIRQVHVIGDHVIVENTWKPSGQDARTVFGVWLERSDSSPRIVCPHYTMDQALLASIALNHGPEDKDWTDANTEAYYAGKILGMERED